MQLVEVLEAELWWQCEPRYGEVKEGRSDRHMFWVRGPHRKSTKQRERETLTGLQRNHLSQSPSCHNELAINLLVH